MKKIIVAIDSFKGCMTSHEANEAATKGLKDNNESADIQSFDVSDGGEGFLEAMQPDEVVNVHVHDALMRWTDAAFGIKDGKAIIEVAQAVGLTKIEPEQRNPLKATSYGVGELIARAWQKGCREFIVGLGGSATSDCGLGMLKSLRKFWQTDHHKMFYDDFDTTVLKNIKVTLATDVTNPLCGPNGAAKIFAPQKGADADMVEKLERKAKTFAEMSAKHQGIDMSNEPGAGAAGGLGYAFMEFMSAKVESGATLVLNSNGFFNALDGASLVITGEGSSDKQTLMGKLPAVILKACKEKDIPVVLLAGKISDKDNLQTAGFSKVICINDNQPTDVDVLDKEVASGRLSTASSLLHF